MTLLRNNSPIVVCLFQSIVAMLPVDSVLQILMKILFDAAVPRFESTFKLFSPSWFLQWNKGMNLPPDINFNTSIKEKDTLNNICLWTSEFEFFCPKVLKIKPETKIGLYES